MRVFDVFKNQPYTFLQISRGGVLGNVILSETEAMGVFKLRNEQVVSDNQEVRQSAATLHVKPEEGFIPSDGQLVGHGIRHDGQDYEIIGQPGGKNYHNGELEHYRLTLEVSDFSEFGS